MGCTSSSNGGSVARWTRSARVRHATGLAAPDDGQFSIPNPFSDDDPKPASKGHRFTKLVSSKIRVKPEKGGNGGDSDSDQFDDPTEVGNGRPPLPKRRTGWSSSMRQLSVATRDTGSGAGGRLGTLKSGTPAGGAGTRRKKIPPMLGQIGRSKTERILSMRQKRNLQIRPGLLKDARGIALGRIENDGTWVGRNNSRQAVFKQDGTIESKDGQQVGRIDPQTGSVLDERRTPIGEILADGSVRDNNENVGHVTADGVAFNLSGQKLGSCDAGPTVSGYIHFFSPKSPTQSRGGLRRSSSSRSLKGRRRSSRLKARKR